VPLAVNRRLPRIALAVALAASVVCAPASALAAGATSAAASALAAKQAERKAALAELDSMRAQLASQVAEFVGIATRLETTRQQMTQAKARLAELNGSIAAGEEQFNQRAAQLYQGGSVTILEILLGSGSLDELVSRAHYISVIIDSDTSLLNDLRRSRSESMWLQQDLRGRMGLLTELQSQADEQQKQIESDLAAQQAKAERLGKDVAQLMLSMPATMPVGGNPNTTFNPDILISETNYRASASITATDIQVFLEQQAGTLDTYRAADHNGVVHSPAEMIAEASVAWGVSPRVILATLQKEQSLLSKTSPSRDTYDWAMGAGKADTHTFTQYRGFGKQIWWGAQKLDKNADMYTPGATLNIDGSVVRPQNGATFGLYRYTPHTHGAMSFWMIYWRYFGDPMT
jgi:peptidoglycan hydrolase CwlO-like protein